MTDDHSAPANEPQKEPERTLDQLAAGKKSGLATELWHFLRDNKKWWLAPLIVMLLLLGTLIALGGTAAAPFIYTLF